jgi:hypothetical protein
MGWIYEISNIENGKTYIGQTNAVTRWVDNKSIKTHGFEKSFSRLYVKFIMKS